MARVRKSRSERSLDAVLGEIERGRANLQQLRENLHLVRKGHVPSALFANERESEKRAEAIHREEYMQQVEAEIARLEEAIAKRWTLAAGLSDGGERLAGSDEVIQAQLGALVERRRSLDRLGGQFREDQHRHVDNILSDHRDRIEALLSSPLGAGEIVDVAQSWAWRDPSLAEALHAAVDARPAEEFAEGTQSDWEAELRTVARQIERRKKELALREQERAAAEAEARRAQAEVELAAIET